MITLTIKENQTFSRVLTINKTVLKASGTHPITGSHTYIQKKEPVSLAGFKLMGQIKDKLDNPTLVFPIEAAVIDAASGRASLSMTREQTVRLAAKAKKLSFGIGTEKEYKIGEFDIFAIDSNNVSTRLFGGEVKISRAVTTDENQLITGCATTSRSDLVPITSSTTLIIDSSLSSHEITIEYYLNGSLVNGLTGTVGIYKRLATDSVIESTVTGTIDAAVAGSKVDIAANVLAIKAEPDTLTGCDHYRLIVASKV